MKHSVKHRIVTRALALLVLTMLCLCTGCLRRGLPFAESDSDTQSGAGGSGGAGEGSENGASGQDGKQTQKIDRDAVAEQELFEDTQYRILLTSDTHYTYLRTWYGVSAEDRMQLWVNSILAEHRRRPFDLIVVMGDVSLDHWKWNGGGSYLKEGISTTKAFVEDYVSQLPENVPVIILPGNHEQYSNAQWKELTGNDRSCSFVLGNNLFIMPDSYSGELDPDYHHDGVYQPMDVDFIQEQMDAYPDHRVYLISHYFNMNLESEEFKALLRDNDRIITLFQGHTHKCNILSLGEECGSKYILQCGNFSYSGDSETTDDILNSFWGFRDLVITQEKAVSRYIIAESDATVNGNKYHLERAIKSVMPYRFKK